MQQLESYQVYDLIRYFAPAGSHIRPHWGTMFAIFDGTEIMRTPQGSCISQVGNEAGAMVRAGLWPDESMYPPPVKYAAVQTAVMQGSEHVATARSHNSAKRIANALNRYKPARRGC